MEPKTGIQVKEKPESHIGRKKKSPGGLLCREGSWEEERGKPMDQKTKSKKRVLMRKSDLERAVCFQYRNK